MIGRKSSRNTRVAGVTSQEPTLRGPPVASPWKVGCLERTDFLLRSEADPDRTSDSFHGTKLLIHDRRERRSRAKDILYLHDTIELFGASLDVLGEEWERAAKPGF